MKGVFMPIQIEFAELGFRRPRREAIYRPARVTGSDLQAAAGPKRPRWPANTGRAGVRP